MDLGRQKIGCFLLACALALPLQAAAYAQEIETYRLYTSNYDQFLRFEGEKAGAQSGASLASADFNNDGIDDLIIGEPLSSTDGKKWNGAVKIIYGSHSKTRFESKDADLVITGAYSDDQLGTSLAVGDFNNDGIDDLSIGAYRAYSRLQRPGKAYIFYGGVDRGSQSLNLLYKKPDVSLGGTAEGEGFGMVLSTVDINGDDVDDLVVSSPFGLNSHGGEVGYIKSFLGSGQGLSTDVHSIFVGKEVGERFGSSVASGDLDGDGSDELVVGAYLSDFGEINNNGAAYIYRNVSEREGDDLRADMMLEGKSSEDWYSFGMLVDDVDFDGVDDLLVSSFPYRGDRSGGKIWAHYGGADFFESREVEILGESVLSRSFVMEDLDSDGVKDLVIGDPGLGGSSQNREGSVYIKYQQEEAKNVNSVIHGEYANDWFGYSVSTLDLNGDGRMELAVSARYADAENSVNNGAVYIYWAIDEPYGDLVHSNVSLGERRVSRGELASMVLGRFNLREQRALEIERCFEHLEFCLFNFIAMSDFEGIVMSDDLVLYPDVDQSHPYYEDVNLATLLGLLNGFLDEDGSPFGPERKVSRIQALKVVLAAADLIEPMYRFELVEELGSLEKVLTQPTYFTDVLPAVPRMWWYPRYVNFAWENGIIEKNTLFRPEENITMSELNRWIEQTLDYLSSHNAQIDVRGNTGEQAIN